MVLNSSNAGLTGTEFVGVLFLVLAMSLAPCILDAQTPGTGGQHSVATGSTYDQGQTYVLLGISSFRVLVPEIKMSQILKATPPKPTPPANESATVGEQAVEIREKVEPAPPAQRNTAIAPETSRLPFEPALRQREQVIWSVISLGAVTERPRLEEPPPAKNAAPSLATPNAPEDLMAEAPAKKEVLQKKFAHQIPVLLEAQRSKETLETAPLKAQEITASEGPVEKIPFGTRGEPEIIPWKETKPSPARLPAIDTESTIPKESSPSMPGIGLDQDMMAMESPSKLEPSIPLAKEVLRSPFDEGTPKTPEIKYYLQNIAPILEEVSLLMAKTPLITIGDYDPSDANAPLFPKDLQLKVDSMKRQLQILDSKTFAIIPPKMFEQFHAIMRDSITQTHQACDAIINYLAEPNEANLKIIQDHLFRARELIQKTRTSQG